MKMFVVRLLETIEGDVVGALKSHIETLYGVECRVDSAPLDIGFAWASARHQYNSTQILARIKPEAPMEAQALLAIASSDLYSQGLNFVFGEAEVKGKVGIISLARLRPSFWGEPDDNELLALRARKEAIHELGHILGLRHCQHKRCVMRFSQTLADTDYKLDHYCPDCAHTVAEIINLL